ncbi:ureidoglycolate lyase [Marinovum sp.]|uniref:ureidoglycolate lyase n=1 Tax=Marinovum sp. TaxID=2024839 RepID=UPI002B27BDF8|nr:ureidoglycolate lyase [Marinovum sp.]
MSAVERITAQPAAAAAMAGLAELIACDGAPDKLINQDRCGRFHDLAGLDIIDGKPGISLFKSEVFALPFRLEMMERHPLGSQAFVPMSDEGFLVVLAEDDDGTPGTPRAFVTAPGQAVNIGRNVWHGVLTPLGGSGLFAVIDRIGDGSNLEEHWFDTAFEVVPG